MRSRPFAVLSMLVTVFVAALLGLSASQANEQTFITEETIAFVSTRDHTLDLPPILGAEIYLIKADGTNLRRLTSNSAGDGFAALSPDGKKIVFESNRIGITEPNLPPTDRCATCSNQHVFDLFVMNPDGSEQVHLTRGSSATWSPDSKNIAFHASASGTKGAIRADPGAATYDNDIFVLNVDDCLKLKELTFTVTSEGDCRKITVAHCTLLADLAKRADCTKLRAEVSRNITNSAGFIDEDPDWSPDGKKIAFARHDPSDPLNVTPPYPMVVPSTEIYVLNLETKELTRLTVDAAESASEERAVDWSKDGTRIAFMCRIGAQPPPPQLGGNFEICVMNADGTGKTRLTMNTVFEGSPSWSPNGQQILFHKNVPGRAQQLFKMQADGTLQAQFTNLDGFNLFGDWGVIRVKAP